MGKAKILVVEDEAIVAKELQMRLQQMGYDVPYTAAKGEDAIDISQKFPPDLVLMDVILQGQIDGIETAREIRLKRKVPIIYLSAYTDTMILDRAKDTEPFGYLSKPFSDHDLHNSIEMALYKHNAEEKLRESEEFIRAVMDHLPIGVAVNSVDPVVDFTYMNDNFHRIYRTTRKALADPDAFWNSVYEDPEFREDIKKRVLDDCASGDPDRMHWEDVPITRKGEPTVFICARNIPVPGKHLMISTVWDITERKRAEDEILKFKFISDHSNDAHFFCDRDAKFQYVNETACKMMGYSQNELLNLGVPDVDIIYGLSKFKELFNLVQRETVPPIETINKRKDGTTFPSEITVTGYNIEGQPYMFTALRDITERKKAEDTLKKSEEILERIFETTHFHVVLLDSEFNFIRVNKAYADTCGFEPDYFIGKNHFDLYPSDELQTAFRGVVKTGHPYSVYSRAFVFPDQPERGTTYWDLAVYPVKKGLGEIEGLLFTLLEVTERKRAESALWESEEQFRTIVEQSPVSIQVMDPDGRAIKVNRAWEKLWGVTMDDLGDYSILKDKQLETLGVMPYLKKGLSGETTHIPAKEYDVAKTLGKGTKRWVQAHIYPVKDEKGDIRIVVLMHEDITSQKNTEIDLKKAFEVINRLKEQLEAENIYLREEVKLQHEHGEILGQSNAIKRTLKLVEQVAGTDSTVLILGETGTGKELVAQSIHNLSKRKHRPMVKVNCAAIPSTLIESELFGREKGAYTGALTTQVGRFEVANGSSLFLDEIGELSSELQAKLLRVIQDGSLERLGSTRTIKVDVRVIAATNRNLEQAVADGNFRSDLYYRLNVFPVFVPPLRERHEDIKTLVRSFITEFEKMMGKQIKSIPRRDVQALQSYSWPGNVRELKNLIERSMILTTDSTLHLEMPKMSESGKSLSRTLDEIQKNHILSVLEHTNWRVRGESGAAEILGLKPTTLDAKMKKLGIKR